MSIVNWLDKTFYPQYGDNWDNRLFREEALRHLDKDMVLLDIGAGAGIVPDMNFQGVVRQVVGVDPDERVLSNPFLDKAYVVFGESMEMIADASVDVAISCNVLEHLDNPKAFFREVYRVLKPGGLFLAKTPNKYHYVPVIARLTPDFFHKFINKQRGRKEVDTYPTRYLVNTRSDQHTCAAESGLAVMSMKYYEARPEYLRMNFLTYGLGIAFERCVNSLGLDDLKVIMISSFRK